VTTVSCRDTPDGPRFSILFPAVVLFLLLSGQLPAAAAPPHVSVLLYHRFGDDRYPSTNVSAESLTAHMRYLRDNDYRCLTKEQFDRIMEGLDQPGPRDVLVTVDDGYTSFVRTGFPIFSRFKIPVVVFLSTAGIEQGYRDLMTWQEIENLRDRNVTFANHGHSHLHGGRRRAGETTVGHLARIRSDVAHARGLLAAHGVPSDWYAYPYGEWTPELGTLLGEMGFRRLFSQDPGVAAPGGGRGKPIPRLVLTGGDVPVSELKTKLSRLPLSADLISPKPGWTGDRLDGIRIVLPGLDVWGTGEVNLFLSEKGRLTPDVDRNTGVVAFTDPIVTERYLNRIIISARDRETNRYRITSWILLNPYKSPDKH